ncbi:DNA polymerase lambda isoform X5 [Macadamia integrifolia]|uniref:DNA polymerase lambda isoform X5 n=1 Tax=Macadamia integrifolia TaxID=60698 RepID=UPI001C4EECC8|nr:DNA polymerase lambda isoform X5 [Macadamia integrifolia]
MAPKSRKKKELPRSPEQPGMFEGMVVFLVVNEVQPRRLQIWKQKLVQMGATIEDRLLKRVTHIFAMNSRALLKQVDRDWLTCFRGSLLLYQWLEESLRLGEKVPEDSYSLKLDSEGGEEEKYLEAISSESVNDNNLGGGKPSPCKKVRLAPGDSNVASLVSGEDNRKVPGDEAPNTTGGSDDSTHYTSSPENCSQYIPDASNRNISSSELSLDYSPPDLNRNITEIFGKLVNIYRALGDDRRSFSYYKAIPVIEKLPFKIESVDQVKHLPSIGKSMQDHIHEIVTTGKLSKLEHFETDEKVVVVCGGSYRRGKATCGDLDIVITHPDGKSHKGFLRKYVKHLKDIGFLREDLIFGIHSEEDTDSGVDTYFGLCTYPGREQRHRIDLKVYPRDIYAFGLIAWTGNDVLNRRLRLIADSKGYRLDDTGLFLATQGSGGKRGARSSMSLSFKTEKEVFDFLGFPWLEPHERNL